MLSAHRDDRGLAIICLTTSGFELGCRLQTVLGEGTLYAPRRLQTMDRKSKQVVFFDVFEEAFAEIFSNNSALLCIMAAGIVVRSLAPLIRSKYRDPAVVVMDEKGRYAVSLLSGHVGGANALARRAALASGGEAVISTASDVQGRPAADLLAMRIQAKIEARDRIKAINRDLAEGKKVYMYSPWPLSKEISSGYVCRDWPGQGEVFAEPAVIISYNRTILPPRSEMIQIKPRNLVMGVGSRKGVSWYRVKEAFERVLNTFNIDPDCIKALASIDLKSDEAAIKQLAESLEVPYICFSKEEILSLQGSCSFSKVVQEKIGVGGVCEPAALLAARPGITVVPKQIIGPVAMSIAMEKSWWWDWARVEESI